MARNFRRCQVLVGWHVGMVCWRDCVRQRGPSNRLDPQNGCGGKPGSLQRSLQPCGPCSEHREEHYFVPCQILPRRKRKHLPSNAVATSSSEAPANLRFAARRAGGSWTADAGRLGSFQEQDPGSSRGFGGQQGFLGPQPRPQVLTLCFVSLSQPACLFLSIARSRSVMTGEQMAAFHPPTNPNPLERPIKMGWLKKQRSIVKNWQQRYFVLRAQHLCYYKDEEDSKPQVPAGCVSPPQAQGTWVCLRQGPTGCFHSCRQWGSVTSTWSSDVALSQFSLCALSVKMAEMFLLAPQVQSHTIMVTRRW